MQLCETVTAVMMVTQSQASLRGALEVCLQSTHRGEYSAQNTIDRITHKVVGMSVALDTHGCKHVWHDSVNDSRLHLSTTHVDCVCEVPPYHTRSLWPIEKIRYGVSGGNVTTNQTSI